MSPFKSWGMSQHPDFEYSPQGSCENQECPHYHRELLGWGSRRPEMYQKIVGFYAEETVNPLHSNRIRVGLIFVECPFCHQITWWHVEESLASRYKELCDNWPKD